MQEPVFIVKCERVPRKQWYKIWFPFNHQIIDRIKELPSETRKWHSLEKTWELTTSSLLLIIKSYKGSNKIHFDFGSEDSRKVFINQIKRIEITEKERKKTIRDLENKKRYWIKWKQELEINYKKYSDRLHAVLKENVKLYPHQIVGAMYLNEVKNALISHEMGIGKSLTSIAYAELNQYKKVFVITPNSLKFNYYGEVLKFTNSKAHIVKWKKNKYSIKDAKYIIVNYDYFNPSDKNKFINKWKKLGIKEIDCLIADESQKLKNTKANTYKNFKRIFGKPNIFRDKKVSKVFLTGTPAPNRAYELYTVLNQISPIDFPTKKYFYEYYCGMTYDLEGFGGWITDIGQARLEELYHKIAPYTHRKRKKEVLKDLPDKIYQKVVLEMTDEEYSVYEDIEEGVINEYVKKPLSNKLTIMLKLRQYTSHLKITRIVELINNILETGEKIVIVDNFKESLLTLKEKFGEIAGLHTGDQSVEERADIVKEFQNPESNMKIFLGSIQTCNYGLTLTAASKLFILALPYVPGEYDQVADRLHRISQKNVVNIYPMIFPDTIDEYVYSSIENKRKEIVKVIDNEDYSSNIEESVLTEVIEKMMKKYGRRL